MELLWVVPVRMLLDLLWWVPLPGGLSAGQVGSGLLALALAAAAAARWRRALDHPQRVVLGMASGLILVGAARAQSGADALTYGLHLGLPILWALALRAWPLAPSALSVWVAAGAVPVVIGLGALALGQPWEHVLNGWPRLLGAYGNVHTHAGVMAVLAVSAVGVARDGRRWAWVVALGAAICLGATFVRTAWLWAGIALLGIALAERRWRVVAALVGLGVVGAIASGRLGDVWAVLTLTPPEGGWGALGSSRGHIWADSLRSWLAGPTSDLLLGRGLGGHLGLHRHLDPHSDLLSLLYQLGPLGPVVWGAWGLGALWRARGRDPLAFGLLLGALCTAPLSNDWLTRSTVLLWVWGGVSRPRPHGSGAIPAPPPG